MDLQPPSQPNSPNDFPERKGFFRKRNILILSAVILLGAFTIAPYVLPGERDGNAAKDIENSQLSVLKQEEIDRLNPDDDIIRLTSDEAPWLSSDGNGKITLYSSEFEGNKLVIPAMLDGKSVHTVTPSPDESENDTVTEIEISEGIQIIEGDCFKNFKSLKTVSFSKTVIHISDGAFQNTPWYDSLEDEFVTVGNGVLFKYNGTDEDVQIPETVKYIDGGAFKNIETAKIIELPQSARYIGPAAFKNCSATKIFGGDNITYIANDAFFDCAWLDEIEEDFATVGVGCMVKYTVHDNTVRIPSAVRQLSGLDFSDGSGENITLIIGENVTRIADLRELGFVKAFKVHKKNPSLSAVSGVLYNYAGTTLYRFPVYKNKKTFYAQRTLTGVGDYAFSDTSLETIELNDGLYSIGDQAFANSKKLQELEIPGTVVQMGNEIFKNSEELKTVSLSERTSIIPYGLFDGCTALREVLLPEKTIRIKPRAFAECYSLEKLYIGSEVIVLDPYFDYNSNIKYSLDKQNPNFILKDNKLIIKK